MPILECAGGCGTQVGTTTVGTVAMLCKRCRPTMTLEPTTLGPEADSRRAGAAVNDYAVLHYGAGSSSTTHAPVLRYGEPTGRWAATSTRWRHASVPAVGVPAPSTVVFPPVDDTRPTVTLHVSRYMAAVAAAPALDHEHRIVRALVWREAFELAFEAANLDERRRRMHRDHAESHAYAAVARWEADTPQVMTAPVAARWWSTVSVLRAGMLTAPVDTTAALEAKRAALEAAHRGDELVWELIEARKLAGVVLQRRAHGLRVQRAKAKAAKGPRRKRQVVGPDEHGEMVEEVDA